MFDHEMGGYMATRYPIEQGHPAALPAWLTRAVPIRGVSDLPAMSARCARLACLSTHVWSLRASTTFRVPTRPRRRCSQLMPPLCSQSSDNIALGLLKRLHEMGKSIPGDISVVSYDNSAADVLFEPALTAIEQDPGIPRGACFWLHVQAPCR